MWNRWKIGRFGIYTKTQLIIGTRKVICLNKLDCSCFIGCVGTIFLFKTHISLFSFRDHFVIQAHSEQASSVDFNDKYLITGSECCTVGVWSMDSDPGKNLHLLEGHKQGITEVRILNAQDTRPMCVSGSYDGSVRIWSIKTGLCLAILLGTRLLDR